MSSGNLDRKKYQEVLNKNEQQISLLKAKDKQIALLEAKDEQIALLE